MLRKDNSFLHLIHIIGKGKDVLFQNVGQKQSFVSLFEGQKIPNTTFDNKTEAFMCANYLAR